MLKYVTMIAPLLLKRGTANPVKTLTGYMGAFFLMGISAVFFLAALFTWIASNYGLDVAFLAIALILMVVAIGLTVMARLSQSAAAKESESRNAQIKAILAAREDPLADHIPEELLTHPMSQKILAQVEEKPFIAGMTAIGLGVMLSRQIFEASD